MIMLDHPYLEWTPEQWKLYVLARETQSLYAQRLAPGAGWNNLPISRRCAISELLAHVVPGILADPAQPVEPLAIANLRHARMTLADLLAPVYIAQRAREKANRRKYWEKTLRRVCGGILASIVFVCGMAADTQGLAGWWVFVVGFVAILLLWWDVNLGEGEI